MVTVMVCPISSEEGETLQDVKARSGWAETREVRRKEELKISMNKKVSFFMVRKLKLNNILFH
jgi:hypothetical protein